MIVFYQRGRRDQFPRVYIAQVKTDLFCEILLRHTHQMPTGRHTSRQDHDIPHLYASVPPLLTRRLNTS